MKIKIVDGDDDDYLIEAIDTSMYDLQDENDVNILKGLVLEAIQNYIEDSLDI